MYVDQPDEILNATWMWRENLVGSGPVINIWNVPRRVTKWLHWERGIDYTGGWFLCNDEVFYEKDFIRLNIQKEINENVTKY